MNGPVRTTAVWVPDWPVVAAMVVAGVPAHSPAAVHDGRRVVATSATARTHGVRRGMRRRAAQGCCPQLVLLTADEGRDQVAFEPVAAAAEQVVAGVEVVRPGLLLLPAGGASRYHGSEEALAIALVEAVGERTGHECGVGTADGLLAAVLAARTGAVVEPGASARFLAEHGVGELVHAATDDAQAHEVTELVDLLHRLGLRTLGAFAALPAPDVSARFGRTGTWAHTLALGRAARPPARRRPEPDLEVETELDPPADRVDAAAFAGRVLAERLHTMLAERRVTCGRLQIAARTDDGTALVRVWRTDSGGWGALTPARVTDRVRWQLEGWLTAAARTSSPEDERPSVTLVRLALTALDVGPAGAEQGRLWGAASGADVRAARALERVQGILGADEVLVAAVQGGRDVREQVHLQPWGQHVPPERQVDLPWPGRLPDPPPATVPVEPWPITLLGPADEPVLVDARGRMNVPPARLLEPRRRTEDPPPPGHLVTGWAGPWLTTSRWWTYGATGGPGVRAHLQVRLDDDRALLLVGGTDGWCCDAQYD
ncbi:MAG: DNA polymerase Y family protein [Actinobacteria bacterium]|nr:DNA polymerase Y family protein [Actinomycetota bacterium]MCG2800809.1 DNA polymerase Y family protein [Cellulomonas sp.]